MQGRSTLDIKYYIQSSASFNSEDLYTLPFTPIHRRFPRKHFCCPSAPYNTPANFQAFFLTPSSHLHPAFTLRLCLHKHPRRHLTVILQTQTCTARSCQHVRLKQIQSSLEADWSICLTNSSPLVIAME